MSQAGIDSTGAAFSQAGGQPKEHLPSEQWGAVGMGEAQVRASFYASNNPLYRHLKNTYLLCAQDATMKHTYHYIVTGYAALLQEVGLEWSAVEGQFTRPATATKAATPATKAATKAATPATKAATPTGTQAATKAATPATKAATKAATPATKAATKAATPIGPGRPGGRPDPNPSPSTPTTTTPAPRKSWSKHTKMAVGGAVLLVLVLCCVLWRRAKAPPHKL